MEVFKEGYSGFYDVIYREKDYVGECDFLEAVFKRYSEKPVRSVLDLGCGTGGHTSLLAGRGYRVAGVDLSEAMLDAARRKAAEGGLGIDYRLGDIRAVRLGKRVDAVVAMFAVMGYQTGNDDVSAAIRTAREHLEPGGLFIFDVWFGPAVVAEGPSDKTLTLDDADGTITRTTKPVLNLMEQTVDVNFHVRRTRGDRVVEETRERHVMRFFFPKEIELLLEAGGFQTISICPFGEPDGEALLSTWNISVIARAEAR